MRAAALRQSEALPPHVLRARKLVVAGRIFEAISTLREGMEEEPSREGALLLARVLVGDDQLEEAAEVLTGWVTPNPDPGVYAVLVRLHQALAQPADAAETVRRALALFPTDSQLSSLAIQYAPADYVAHELDPEVCSFISVQSVVTAESVISSIVDITCDLESLHGEARKPSAAAETELEEAETEDLPTAVARPRGQEQNSAQDPTEGSMGEPEDDADEERGTERLAKGKPFGPLLGGAAPSLEAAVQRFATAAAPQQTKGLAVFSTLLGDGPPLPSTLIGKKADEPPTPTAAKDPRVLADEEQRKPAELAAAFGNAVEEAVSELELRSDSAPRQVDQPQGTPLPMMLQVPDALPAEDQPTEKEPSARRGESNSPAEGAVELVDLDDEDREEGSFRRPGLNLAARSDEPGVGQSIASEPLLSEPSLFEESSDPGNSDVVVTRDREVPPGDTASASDDLEASTPREGPGPRPGGQRRQREPEDVDTKALRPHGAGRVRRHTPTGPPAPPQMAPSSVPDLEDADTLPTVTERRAAHPPPIPAGLPKPPPAAPKPPALMETTLERLEQLNTLNSRRFVAVAPVQISRPGEATAPAIRLSLNSPAPSLEEHITAEHGSELPTGDYTPGDYSPGDHAPGDYKRGGGRQRKRSTAQVRNRNKQPSPEPLPETASYPSVLQPPRSASLLRRHSSALVGLLLVLLALSVVGGFWLQKRVQAAQQMEKARLLARGWELTQLRRALERARRSAASGGRTAEIVAFAAATHARLAYELGESSVAGVDALVEESKRLGAPYVAAAKPDLQLAEAYRRLATKPLPAVIFYLQQRERTANPAMTRLEAMALLRAGQREKAAAILSQLPPSGFTLRIKALSLAQRGRGTDAMALLRQGPKEGLGAEQVALTMARVSILHTKEPTVTLGQLLRLAKSSRLGVSERAWATLLAAVLAERRGNRTRAAELLKRALKASPVGDPDFAGLAAQQLLVGRQLERAQAEIDRVRRIAPQHPDFLYLRARVALAAGQARKCIDLLFHRKDLGVAARALLVRALLKEGDPSGARAALSELPIGSERVLLAARIDLGEARPARAKAGIMALVDKKGPCNEACVIAAHVALSEKAEAWAKELLGRALEHDPDNDEALWLLGRIHASQGAFAEARAVWSRALKPGGALGHIRRELAGLLMLVGEHRAAEREFDSALRHAPEDLKALAGRAAARIELRSPQAERDLTQLDVAGRRAVAGILRARRAMLAGRDAKAARIWPRASVAAFAHLGQLWRAELATRNGNTRRAYALLRPLQKVVGLTPLVLLAQSELALAQRAPIRALAKARAVLTWLDARGALEGLRVRAGIQMARCHLELEETGAAIAELQEVLSLAPTHGAAHLALGRIYLQLKKARLAARHLVKARASMTVGDKDREVAQALLRRSCSHASARAVCGS